MPWEVQVIESLTDQIVQKIPCADEREATYVERKVIVNLNEDYHTAVRETPRPPQPPHRSHDSGRYG